MHPGIGPEHREVFDLHMATQTAIRRDDRIRTDLAVMAHMGIVHDEIVVTESGATAATCRADMDRHMLADDGTQADLETGRFAREGLILWFAAQARMRKDPRASADSCLANQCGVRPDFHSRTEFYVSPNEDEGPHDDIGGKHRPVFDAGRRVDHGHDISPFD